MIRAAMRARSARRSKPRASGDDPQAGAAAEVAAE